MNSTRVSILFAVGALVAAVPCALRADSAGTAFTYQGQLRDNGVPIDDACDIEFTLYDALTAGSVVSGPLLADDWLVINGLFTVPLDFGEDCFTGDARWLEVAVQCSGDVEFTTLTPRQELTPAPYALALPGLWTEQNAQSPNVIGGYSNNNVTPGVHGATIGGGGYSGLAHGVTDNWGTVGGGYGNTAGLRATVSGGSDNFAANIGTVGGGDSNQATATYATVSGGVANIADSTYSTVPGGTHNVAGGQSSFAAGKYAQALHHGAFVWSDSTGDSGNEFQSTAVNQFLIRAGGGVGINTNDPQAVLHVGGTAGTDGVMFPDGTLQTTAATGGPGDGWSLTGNAGTTPGTDFLGTTDDVALELHVNSQRALRIEPDATSPNLIAGHSSNSVAVGIHGATIGGGRSNDALSDYCTVAGGEGNSVTSEDYATVGGGSDNTANGYAATIAGGDGNEVTGEFSTVAGGENNSAFEQAVVSGGVSNTASGVSSMIPGGTDNTAAGDYSLAAGRHAKANHDGAFVWADSEDADFASTANDQFLIRAGGGVGIGTDLPQAKLHVDGGSDATLGGGGYYVIGSETSTNICFDNNEIIARNNGAAAGLSLNSGSGDVFICYNGGNVGIGTAAPDNALSVSGDANFTSRVGIGVSDPEVPLHVTGGSDAAPAGGGFLVLGGTGGANVVVDNNEIMARDNGSPANLMINGEGADLFLCPYAGNVGIGTDSPAEKLHVAGKARCEQLQVTDNATAGYVLTADTDGNASWAPGGGSLWSQDGSDIYYDSGRVGIGPSDPEAGLHVTKTGGESAYSMTGIKAEAGWSSPGNPFDFWVRGIEAEATGEHDGDNIGVLTQASGNNTPCYGVYATAEGGASYGIRSVANGTGTSKGIYTLVRSGVDNVAVDARHVVNVNNPSDYITQAILASATYAGYFAGDVSLRGNLEGYNGIAGSQTIEINGNDGIVGQEGFPAVRLFRPDSGAKSIELLATEGSDGGQISIYNSDGVEKIILDAEHGGVGHDSRIIVDVLQITGGSDLSEQFEVSSDNLAPQPGMVVCIDPAHPGQLKMSTMAYDPKVAGVISGAGGIAPGMLMGQRGTVADGKHPVALTGRVWCRCDASCGAIEPGDRLTTSATPGHAMRVSDESRAPGTVLGKAMTSLTEGRGLVLMLVQPQ